MVVRLRPSSLLRSEWLASLLGAALITGCTAGGGGGGGDDVVTGDDVMGDDQPNTDGGGQTECIGGGLGAWTGNDNVRAVQTPPCGLAPSVVPQFVVLGFDDNGDPGGMTWALDMLHDRDVKASFYMTSTYAQSEQVKATWKRAYDDGHEVGNHTVQHLDGATYTADQWQAELSGCNEVLKTIMPADEIIGFRTPFLSYNDAELETVDSMGFHYDCSIEEGYEDKQDGTNFYWPYTLDNLSPGHTVQVSWGEGKVEINAHPGLWEIPVYAVFVPPDSKCADYGVPSGLRAKLKGIQDWFDVDGGSITGFDYNLWAIRSAGGFEMTKAEFLASLKYTFDQHYNGNRAPFTLGAHTAYYMDSWSTNAPGAMNASDRQAAIEEFIDYVKAKPGVKVTSAKELMEWVRNPSAL